MHAVLNNTKIKEFLESKLFIVLIGILTLGCFGINSIYFTVILFCLLLSTLLLFNAKLYSVVSMASLIIAGFRKVDFSFKDVGLYFAIVVVAATIGLLMYKIIKNKKITFTRFKKCSIVYTTLLLGLTMIISIINSPVKLTTLALTGLWLANIAIILIMAYGVPNDEKTKHSIAFSFVVLLYVIFIQTIICSAIYIHDRSYNDLIGIKDFTLGWALSNHAVIPVNIGVVFSCYLFFKSDKLSYKIFYVVSALIGVFINCFVACRGGMLGLAVCGILVLSFAFIYYKKYWKIILASLLGAIVLVVLALVILRNTSFVSTLLSHFKDIGVTDGGRSNHYDIVFSLFKDNWFIGTGWGSSHYYLVTLKDWDIYNYHCWFLQILGPCGILGLVAFIIYLIDIFRVKNYKDPFTLFVFIVMAYALVHGFVDTVIFNKKFQFLLTILITAVKFYNYNPEDFELLN